MSSIQTQSVFEKMSKLTDERIERNERNERIGCVVTGGEIPEAIQPIKRERELREKNETGMIFETEKEYIWKFDDGMFPKLKKMGDVETYEILFETGPYKKEYEHIAPEHKLLNLKKIVIDEQMKYPKSDFEMNVLEFNRKEEVMQKVLAIVEETQKEKPPTLEEDFEKVRGGLGALNMEYFNEVKPVINFDLAVLRKMMCSLMQYREFPEQYIGLVVYGATLLNIEKNEDVVYAKLFQFLHNDYYNLMGLHSRTGCHNLKEFCLQLIDVDQKYEMESHIEDVLNLLSPESIFYLKQWPMNAFINCQDDCYWFIHQFQFGGYETIMVTICAIVKVVQEYVDVHYQEKNDDERKEIMADVMKQLLEKKSGMLRYFRRNIAINDDERDTFKTKLESTIYYYFSKQLEYIRSRTEVLTYDQEFKGKMVYKEIESKANCHLALTFKPTIELPPLSTRVSNVMEAFTLKVNRLQLQQVYSKEILPELTTKHEKRPLYTQMIQGITPEYVKTALRSTRPTFDWSYLTTLFVFFLTCVVFALPVIFIVELIVWILPIFIAILPLFVQTFKFVFWYQQLAFRSSLIISSFSFRVILWLIMHSYVLYYCILYVYSVLSFLIMMINLLFNPILILIGLYCLASLLVKEDE